jgi:hypothetical protein
MEGVSGSSNNNWRAHRSSFFVVPLLLAIERPSPRAGSKQPCPTGKPTPAKKPKIEGKK